MAGDTGRPLAERQERGDRPFSAEPAAEEFGTEQEHAKGPAKAKAMPGVLLFCYPSNRSTLLRRHNQYANSLSGSCAESIAANARFTRASTGPFHAMNST